MRRHIHVLGLIVPLVGVVLSVATSSSEELLRSIRSERVSDTITLTAAQPRSDVVVEIVGNDTIYVAGDTIRLSAILNVTTTCIADSCVVPDGGPIEAGSRVRVSQQVIRDGALVGSASVLVIPNGEEVSGLQSSGELDERTLQVFVRFELLDSANGAIVEWNAHGTAAWTTMHTGPIAPPGSEVLISVSDAPTGLEPVDLDDATDVVPVDGGP